MTGTGFLGLILVSMAWLLFLAGLALRVWPLAGIGGSLAAFATILSLGRYGVEVPWPWLWILAPLLLALQKR